MQFQLVDFQPHGKRVFSGFGMNTYFIIKAVFLCNWLKFDTMIMANGIS